MKDFQRKERMEKLENIGIIASSGWFEESLVVWLHFLLGYKVIDYTWSLISLLPYPFLEESIFLIQLPRMYLSPSLGQSPFLIRMLVPSIGVAKSDTTREPDKANSFINKSWFET